MAGTLALRIWRWVEDITPHPRSFPAAHWTHSVPVALRWVGSRYASGWLAIHGTVRVDGAPAARRVSLLDRRDLQVIRSVWSDPVTGEYVFDNLADGDYCVLCDDCKRTYNAAVADWVTPEPME